MLRASRVLPKFSDSVHDQRLVERALALAAQGIPVFPCAKSKHPCISREAGGRGFHDATTDRAEIRRLFSHRGAALIGVPTGPHSGFDVLDIDYRHAGRDWEIANAHRLPPTRVHQTRSGGRHYLFRHTHGVVNSEGHIAPGIDVRGAGGYAIVPPSRGYIVISGDDIAPWPQWLLQFVLPPPPSAPARPVQVALIESARIRAFIDSVLATLSRTPDGQKHRALRSTALVIGGIAEQAGLSDDACVGRLVEALPPTVKNWKIARDTAAWGVKEGRKKPIQLNDRPYGGRP